SCPALSPPGATTPHRHHVLPPFESPRPTRADLEKKAVSLSSCRDPSDPPRQPPSPPDVMVRRNGARRAASPIGAKATRNLPLRQRGGTEGGVISPRRTSREYGSSGAPGPRAEQRHRARARGPARGRRRPATRAPRT